MKYTCIDTHTHLNLPAFAEDREEVLARTLADKVAHINVGTTEATSTLAVEIADTHEGSWAIIGLHPIQTAPGSLDEEEASGGTPVARVPEVFNPAFYRALAKSPKVVGIGECGLDYYRLSERRESAGAGSVSALRTEREKGESSAYYHTAKDSYAVQEEAFIAQIQLANELSLPLMIHTRGPKPGEESPTGRSVYADVLLVLKQYATVPGNIHFYAGTLEEAKAFFDIGFTVSFTGVITFAKVYEDMVRAIPLSLMHAETDAPYVSPVPYRGQRCEPRYVAEVVKKIAEIKQLPLEEVQLQLLKNAEQLYKIKLI